MNAASTATLTPEYTIQFQDWTDFLDENRPLFNDVLQAAFSELDFPAHDFSVSLVFTNDAAIRDLNRDYRSKDKATNVLSFPMFDNFETMPDIEDALELGDIILAHETILQETEEQNKSLRDHVAHLLVHGFLHLCGFDHMTDKEAEEMEKLEVDILAQFNISDPYQAD